MATWWPVHHNFSFSAARHLERFPRSLFLLFGCLLPVSGAHSLSGRSPTPISLPPGGCLAGVLFLTPHDSGEESDGPPYAASIDELDERFAPWFVREKAWVPEEAYPGREGREWLAVYRRK